MSDRKYIRVLLIRLVSLSSVLVSCGGCGPSEEASSGDSSGRQCVWGRGTDSKGLGTYLNAWTTKNGLGKVTKWNVKIRPRKARVTLDTKHSNGVYLLILGAACKGTPRVEVVSRNGTAPVSAAALKQLARGFPAPKKQLHGGTRADWQMVTPQGWSSYIQAWDPESWGFLLISLILVLLAWFAEGAPPPYRRIALGVTILGVVALVGYSVAPLFSIPFSNDAPVLRAAYSREAIFGDWNHSFLPYLLNHPTTRFSMESWALRIVPLGWLLAESALLVLVARRQGGLAAGALAGVWFASEVRRRQGFVELTDWDLAGFCLLALVLWTLQARQDPARQDPARQDPGWTVRRSLWLVALMTAAFLSSYMMIIPVTALVGLLWLDPATRRRFAPLATGVWSLLALRAANVFMSGSGAVPTILNFDDLARMMVQETPFSRTVWLLVPFCGALVWLAWGWRRLSHRFVAVSMAAIPLATLVAWRFSHVNNGYYICLTSPLILLASAAAVGTGAQTLRRWMTKRLGGAASGVIVAGGLTALTLVTVSLWVLPDPSKFATTGLHNMAAFEKRIARDRLPIVTNTVHLGLYVGYERARRGVQTRGPLLGRGPKDIAARSSFMNSTCRVQGGWKSLGPSFYFVREAKDPHIKPCKIPSSYTCRPLFRRRVWLNYYHCTATVEPKSRTAK
jgi:hypothetical protein